MKLGQATGFQAAFLMFAVMLVAVPLSSLLIKHASMSGVPAEIVTKGMHFGLAIALIVAFSPLRRFAWKELRVPIPRSKRTEVALVIAANCALALAAVGGLAAWYWFTQGPERVAQMTVDVDGEIAKAFSPAGLVKVVLAILVAPIVEEVVFRGFIFRAFERRWGWFVSMMATSLLFGVYHPFTWNAFAFSIVCVCILRRSGSLRAPILVHVAFNLLFWAPLLGQYLFPPADNLRDASSWYLHFACLTFVLVALPIYVWMSRDRVAPTMFLEPDAALSK